jgi:CheY-like chemotaxis protein
VEFHARPYSIGEAVVWSGVFAEVVPTPQLVTNEIAIEPEPQQAPVALPRRDILVIAREEDAARLLTRTADLWEGATVSVAPTAGLGLELAKRRPPHVIVVGPDIPDMRPSMVVEAVREDPDLDHIPAIVFSPGSGQSERTQLLRIGATAVIEADLTFDSLRSSVLSLIAPPQ